MRLERWPLARLRLLFGGLLLLAALGSLASSVYFATQTAVVSRELRAQRALLRRERRLAKALPEVQQRHGRFMGDLGALEPTVAQPLFNPTLVTQLGELAESYQMTLIGLAPDGAEVEQALSGGSSPRDTRHRLVASVSGRFPNLLGLLEGLQQAPKALSLQSLEARAQPGVEDGSIVADLALLAYETPGVLPPTADLPPRAVTWIILRSQESEQFSPVPPVSYPTPLPRFDLPPPALYPTPPQPDTAAPPSADTATPAAIDTATPAAEPPAVAPAGPSEAPAEATRPPEAVPYLPAIRPPAPDQGLTSGGGMPPPQAPVTDGRPDRVWRGRRDGGAEVRR